MIRTGTVLTLFMLSVWGAGAQTTSVTVIPLNDNSSLRTHISLPFAMKFSDSGLLTKINTLQNSSCRTLIDPFISTNFFVKCTEPGDVTLEIAYMQGGTPRSIKYGPFKIIALSETGTLVEDTPQGPSADILKGQELWNKTVGNYRSCAYCHGSPANKAHAISEGSLNSAYATTEMGTKALPLTADEKKIIIKFVQSYR